jgi:hypothetical protein
MALFVATPLYSDFNDFFASWSEFFDFFGDSNSGLVMFPSLLIPSGGRYEGMGTAFTAVADDSGLLEANPAGSSGLSHPELAFQHHNWISDSAVETVTFVTGGRRLGFGAGAKLFYSPFTAYDGAGERISTGYFSELLITANGSMRLVDIADTFSLSVGVNVKGIFRYVSEAIAADQSAFALPLDVGVLARFPLAPFSSDRTRNAAFGVALKNIAPTVYPAGYPLPTILSVGISYAPVRALLLAVDANVPISFDAGSFPAAQFDLAGGLDLRVTRFLAFHTGLHFKADNPRASVGSTVSLGRIDFNLNYNVDLMGGLNPVDMFSATVALDLGDRQ